MKKLLKLILCISLFLSCEKKVPLSDLDLSVEPKVILSGSITEGQLFFGVAKSQSIENKKDLVTINNAEAFLFKEGVYLQGQKLNITPFYSYITDELSNYDSIITRYEYSILAKEITAGNRYMLKVKVPDFDTLYASSYIPVKPTFEIVSIQFLYQTPKANRYSVTLKIDDFQNEDNFYWLEVAGRANQYEYNPVKLWYPGAKYDEQNIYIFNDKKISKNNITIDLIEPFANGRIEKVFLELYQKDSASYYYRLTRDAQDEMDGTDSFYAFEPINIYSNVINGHGNITSASQIKRDSINLIELFPDILKAY